MARRRDYKAEYARRQERARARGFRGYYEQRTRPRPGAPKPAPAELARARGHRSYADLLGSLREGDLVGIDPIESERDPQGRWTRVTVTVLDEEGEEREYTLSKRQLSDARIRELVDQVNAKGAINSPLYPVGRLIETGTVSGLDIGEEAA